MAFNSTGDWIALGCSGLGQLLVWEWQSETYVMKQQGHFNNMQCLAYSPDGHHLATGGDDGKVSKVYLSYGSCLFVRFDYVLVNNYSSISGWVFLGLTSTKQRIKCLAQGHNTVPPVRLEPATPRS